MKDAATRDAYGETLLEIGENPNIVVLDSGVSDSTRTKKFGQKFVYLLASRLGWKKISSLILLYLQSFYTMPV